MRRPSRPQLTFGSSVTLLRGTSGAGPAGAPGTAQARPAPRVQDGHRPSAVASAGGQARETIRSPNEPAGAVTVTVSPARRPMSARPTGEVLLMRPWAGDASWLPTIV